MSNDNQDFEDQQPADQQQPEPEQHWTLAATEQVRYGDDEQARDALLNVVRGTIAHEDNLRRIRDETDRTNRLLEKFKHDNSDLANGPWVEGAATRHSTDATGDDLVAAKAYDAEKFRKDYGRDPTPQEVSMAHVALRAARHEKARSAETLLNNAADVVSERFGLSRRGRSLEDSYHQTMVDRVERSAAIRGQPARVIERQQRSNDSDSDALTTRSPVAETMRQMGLDTTPDVAPDAAPAPAASDRSSAVSRMQEARHALKQSRPVIKYR